MRVYEKGTCGVCQGVMFWEPENRMWIHESGHQLIKLPYIHAAKVRERESHTETLRNYDEWLARTGT